MHQDLSALRGLILDMDGVLWRGNQILVDLPRVFAEIQRKNFRFILATNNSTRSRNEILQKMHRLGLLTIEASQILNSSEVAGRYLRLCFPQGGKVFIIGEQGLYETLQSYGFEFSEQSAQAVVVGLDRELTYQKLAAATRLILAGALFLGTNADVTLPVADGVIPGAGAILQAVQAATGKSPIILGKPYAPFFDMALELLGLSPEEVLVVGDRLETDILGGQRAKCQTALVLSGVTDAEVLDATEVKPNLIVQDLEELVALLPG